MDNFISVSIPSRKAKKAVLEKMLKSTNLHETTQDVNYGVFEDDNKNIILKLEIPSQLSEKHSDAVAHNLSEDLFNMGYKDFDIEISTDETNEQSTLENTNWHNNVNERTFEIVGLKDGSNRFVTGNAVNKSLPYVMATLQGRYFRIHAENALLNKFLNIQKNNPNFKQDGGIKGGGAGAQKSADLIAGEVYTPGKPMTPKQVAATDARIAMGNTISDQMMKDYEAGKKQLKSNKKTTTSTGAEPGSEEALKAIVNQYAKPGMTLADVGSMEKAAIASEPPSAPDDANIFKKAFQGFKKFAKSKSWRVQYTLANAAEKMNLPGLIGSNDKFYYMAEQRNDDESGNFDPGGPSVAGSSTLKALEALAKVGLVPQSKLDKLQKAFANQPKMKPRIDAIVAAQKAATGGDQEKDIKKSVDAINKDTTKAVEPEKSTSSSDIDNMSTREATEKAYELIKRLNELLRSAPQSIEETKKMLMKKLQNNYIFEDAATDKEIYDIVSQIRELLPKLSDADKRMMGPTIRKSKPYVLRHSKTLNTATVKTGPSTATDKKDVKTDRICAPGNPLAEFAKSGKGGLKNDPDEIAAIKELQKYLGIKVDGKYGTETKNAVKKYQQLHGLKVDSDAGPETIGHMMEKCKKGEKPPATDPKYNALEPKGDGEKTTDDKTKEPVRPKVADLTDGVAPPEEQTNDKVIKFNWKNNSYYIDVKKVEITDDNKIAWLFYKDEDMKNPQKVDILAEYWIIRIEKELKRRGEKDTLKIIAPVTDQEGGVAQGIDQVDSDDDGDTTGSDQGSAGPIVKQDDGSVSPKDAFQQTEMLRFDSYADFQQKKERLQKEGKLKAGDRVLIQVGGRLVGKYYEHIVVSTTGGDLAAVLPNDKDMDGVDDKTNKPINPDGSEKEVDPEDDDDDDDDDDKKDSTVKKVPPRPSTQGGRNKLQDRWDEKHGKTHNPDGTPKPADEIKKQEEEDTPERIANVAEEIFAAVDGPGTNEKKIMNALKTLKDRDEYDEADELFKTMDGNDDNEDIITRARSEMNTPDMERYFYSQLRRLKVPHRIPPVDWTRLKGFLGGTEFNKRIARNYDKKTGKYLHAGGE